MKSNALQKRKPRKPTTSDNQAQPDSKIHLTSTQDVDKGSHNLSHDDPTNTVSSLGYVQDHLETEIGKQIEEIFCEYSIDIDQDSNPDWSPEATAQRIYDFMTPTYQMWCDLNPDLGGEELVDGFEETIRNAINEGHSQTIDILSSVEFDDGILESASETVFILHKMLNDYFTDLYAQLEEWEGQD